MDLEAFLAHHGVKGQRWGVRRDPKTGIRPIAKTLNDSSFGRATQRNIDRHNKAQSIRSNTKLTGAEKVAVGASVVGTYLLTAPTLASLTLNPFIGVAGGGLAAGTVGTLVETHLKKNKNINLSQLK